MAGTSAVLSCLLYIIALSTGTELIYIAARILCIAYFLHLSLMTVPPGCDQSNGAIVLCCSLLRSFLL